MRATLTILGLQAVLLFVLLFGDFGFDHPGKWGLDFGHFLMLSGTYAVVFLIGIVRSVMRKTWKPAAAQITLLALALGWAFRPPPHFDARDYQRLVGQTRREVERVVDDDAVFMHNIESGPEGMFETYIYHGMTILYSADQRVLDVTANDL